MKQIKLDKIPNGYKPLDEKKKSFWNWKTILGLFIILIVSYTIKNINDRRVEKSLKNTIPVLEKAYQELSTVDSIDFDNLKEQVLNIIMEHLSFEEFEDYVELINKASQGNASSQEIDRGNTYYAKVKSACSSTEKEILKKWESLIVNLSKEENNEKM